MNFRKMVSLLLIFAVICSATVCGAQGGVVISSLLPADGSEIELVKDGTHTFSCEVSGGEIIKFLLNGEVFAEFEENGTLTHTLASSDIGLGNKRFEVVVLDANGTVYTEVSDFTTYTNFKGKINSGVSTDKRDFNSMSDVYATKTGDLTTFSDSGLTVSGDGFRIKRETGKSGASGDYALGIYPTVTTGTKIKLDGWTEQVTSGIISLEYDWTIRPLFTPSNENQWKAVSFSMLGLPSYTTHGGIVLSGSRNIYNTAFEYAQNPDDTNASAWTNMRYEYDVDNNKCSLWINGIQYWDKISTVSTDSNNLSQLVLSILIGSGASWWIQNKVAYLMLDNFEAYMKSKFSCNAFEYSEGGVATVFSDGSLPFGTQSVSMEFSSPLGTLANDDIELYADGKKLTHGGVSVDGKKLTVSLPAGLSATDIQLKTRQGLETFGDVYVPGGLSFNFHVNSKINSSSDILVNSSASGSVVSLTVGDVVSASYTAENLSNADQDILLVLTVRENGSLVSVSAKEIKALANDTDTFALPPIIIEESGNYDISLVAVGGFLNSETFN